MFSSEPGKCVRAAYAEGISQVTEGMLRAMIVPASSLDAYVSPDSDAKISDLPQIKLAEPGAREVDRWQEKGGKAKREGIIRSRRLSGPPWGMPVLSLMLMHAKAL